MPTFRPDDCLDERPRVRKTGRSPVSVSVSASGSVATAAQSIANLSYTFSLVPMPGAAIQGGRLQLNFLLYGVLWGDCKVTAIISASTIVAGNFIPLTTTQTLGDGSVLGMDRALYQAVPMNITFDLPSNIDAGKPIGGSVGLDLTTYCNHSPSSGNPITNPGSRDHVTDSAYGELSPANFQVLDKSGNQIPGYTMTSNAGNVREVGAPVAADPRQEIAAEFYNAGQDHCFLTANPAEAGDLDAVVHTGWMRTGFGFNVIGTATAALMAKDLSYPLAPVCRFYIPPEHGDSHFFSADPAECARIQQLTLTDPNYSGFVYETASAFYVALPDRATGACPATTLPVYRLWNHRADSNHRYTTDPLIAADMVAQGYVAEGYGPNAVIMCAPQ